MQSCSLRGLNDFGFGSSFFAISDVELDGVIPKDGVYEHHHISSRIIG
jgi:hypothetical protein